LEHQNHPQKPSYALTVEEEIFGLLVTNERYKDFQRTLSILIHEKGNFLKKNVDAITRKITHIKAASLKSQRKKQKIA